MKRTQIQITEEQSKILKKIAKEENVSVAKLIRTGIDDMIQSHMIIDKKERKKRAIEAAYKPFHSGKTDISENHDKHFTESIDS